jgi:flagellar biosynthetic protein FliO
MELWYTAGKTFAMLCVVLGILLAFLYALKRLTQKGGIDHCQIKLISSFSIAPRKQIMVVDVMHERLVLGVTANDISCISKLNINDISNMRRPFENERLDDTDAVDNKLTQNSLAINSSLRESNNNPNNNAQVQSEQ